MDSTTFIKKPPSISLKEECILYTKKILCGRIFLGHYQNRQYVSAINQHRDLVLINSEDKELMQDTDKVIKKWINVSDISWIGITKLPGTHEAYCFWVELSNLAFGHYWFQIKYVKISSKNELLMKLKCIGKYFSLPSAVSSPVPLPCSSKNETSTSTEFSFNNNGLFLDAGNLLSSIQKVFIDIISIIHPYITWNNFYNIVKVIFSLAVALFNGIISFIRSSGEYVLRFIRELSILVQAFSPIVIQLIDFITKIFGGILILLASMFGVNIRYATPEYRQVSIRKKMAPNVSQRPISNINWRERNQILRRELLS